MSDDAGMQALSRKTSFVSWLTMVRIGFTVTPSISRRSMRKTDRPWVRRSTWPLGVVRAKKASGGVLNPGYPHFLPVDDVAVAVAHRCREQLGRVRSGSRLGHGERLQAQGAGRDPG